MSWHYRIRKRIINNEPWFDIVEYIKPSHRMGAGWTKEGIAPGSETRGGVIEVLEMMLKDAKHYKTLVEK